MRKVWLILIALLLAGGGLFIYQIVSGPAKIPQTEIPETDLSMPEGITADNGQMDGADIDVVEDSRWIRRDPVTKKVVEVGGFSKLLTPPEGGGAWQVQSPYLIRYEDRFTCRIDADQGRIQMEHVGDLPTNVELIDNVRLDITPADQKDAEEKTNIYLDTLTYSSERSEFSTDGPVRVVSRRADMKGRGLILIYNPRTSRMEYLEVSDLDYLLVKDAGADWKEQGSSEKTVAGEEDMMGPPAMPATAAAPAEVPAAVDADAAYYQCSIQNNVVIQYGRELVVVGADQVNIQRILWGRGSSKQPTASAAGQPQANAGTSVGAGASVSKEIPKIPTAAERKPPAFDPTASMNRDDVLITCDGGIIIQPMEARASFQASTSLPSVEMTGQLHIERYSDQTSDRRVPLASCSALRYVLRDEILELFTDSPQSPIQIYLDQTGSMIETLGTVFWNRKTNLARVDGPGKVYFSGDSGSAEKEKREVTFAGLMDLEFAEDMDASSDSALSLKTVNLTGGMEAFLHDQGLRSRAQQARFLFHPANKPDRMNFKGDVHFETNADGQKSQVQAHETVLHFDSAGQLQSANLTGQVRMTSPGQTAQAETADIQFQQGEDGRAVPGQVHLQGKSQIESASEKDVPPTRFEAIQIDYDLQNGRAIASGPIRFTFWTPVDEATGFLHEPIPVDITAHDHAEFATDGKGAIRQVTFVGKVVAQWKADSPQEQMLRRCFGEKLIVDLSKDSSGANQIRHVSLQDQQVLFESIHTINGQKVNHVTLTCRQFDYEAAGERITATGPGELQLNNKQAAPVTESQREFSLKKPCFAYMDGFDQLAWNLSQNRVLAHGEKMFLSYLPVEGGVEGDLIKVQCVHAQAQFASSESGKSELVYLKTDGGVSYQEDKKDGLYLQGDSLVYNQDSEWVVIEGTDAHPCKANGVRVPVIRFNPQTKDVKFKLSTSPSSLPALR